MCIYTIIFYINIVYSELKNLPYPVLNWYEMPKNSAII